MSSISLSSQARALDYANKVCCFTTLKRWFVSSLSLLTKGGAEGD